MPHPFDDDKAAGDNVAHPFDNDKVAVDNDEKGRRDAARWRDMPAAATMAGLYAVPSPILYVIGFMAVHYTPVHEYRAAAILQH